MLWRGQDAVDGMAFRSNAARFGAQADKRLRDILTGKTQGNLGSSKWDVNNVPIKTPPPGYKLDEVIEYGGS